MATFSYRGITKVGEGAEKGEQDIPIEIRAAGVLDWLLDRNAVSRAWAKQASACRKDGKDYVALREGMERLLATTADTSKGLFGGYNDAALAACDAALAAYAKGSTHLAECAAELAHCVKYGAPAEKKAIEKTHKQLADLERLATAAEEEIASATRHYERQCAELGIAPRTRDVESALEGLVVSRLPALCDGVVAAMRVSGVKKALVFYDTFARHVRAMAGGEVASRRCPVLAFVAERGNVPWAELEAALRPQASKQQPQQAVTRKVDDGEVWEIENVGEGDEESVLGALDSRLECMDNLHELLAFLQGRLREKQSSEAAALGLQDALLLGVDCPEVVRSGDTVDSLQAMRDAVAHVIALMDAPQFAQLAEVKASRQYVARLAALVQKRQELIELAKERRQGLLVRRDALLTELAGARERLAGLGKREERLRHILEEGIGKKFSRRVEISTQ
jgi:hypothetical protein